MSGRVRIWLDVTVRASSFGGDGDGTLLVREVEMAFVPDLDGTCNLEMQQMHVDPRGPLRAHLERRTVSFPARDRTWWTDQDGDPLPLPLLLASGWEAYEDWKARNAAAG